MSGENTAFFYGTHSGRLIGLWLLLGSCLLMVSAWQMAPEVFFSVCIGSSSPPKAICDLYTFTPAILHEHCRHRICGVDYPAVVPEKGHSVRGIYATGLTDANIDKLDMFEGSEYERVKVKVQLLNSEGHEAADGSRDTFVYIFILPELLDRREWDYDEFRREKMMINGWTRGERHFVHGVEGETANENSV
ncbi:hypothetical protein CDD81_1374 [Ophiocordyceps australis]|uniref:Putative gamma-glutamylcyclotransferase n=1 Tax=Ophiocordyceps australis TaxID=1399860 RepID=A0A2C5XZ37_9HYPO|nr:hypothetical protein CDD81_1374 [Ophiocordyceps australis]